MPGPSLYGEESPDYIAQLIRVTPGHREVGDGNRDEKIRFRS